MSVEVDKSGGYTAQITWTPNDDPHGRIARAVESDQLAWALEALGDERDAALSTTRTGHDTDRALSAAKHTTGLARELERRAAIQIVHLRETYGLSWRQIAATVHGDPDRQSSVRRQYDAGRRHRGI